MLNYLDSSKWCITRILEESYCVFYGEIFDRSVTKEPKKLKDDGEVVKLSMEDLVSVKLCSEPAKKNDFSLSPSVGRYDISGALIKYHFEKDGKSYDIEVRMPNGLLIEIDKHNGFDDQLCLNIKDKKNLRMVYFNDKNKFFLLDKDMEIVKNYYAMQKKANDSEYDSNHFYVKKGEVYLYVGDFYTPTLSITSNPDAKLEWKNKFKESHVFINPWAIVHDKKHDNTQYNIVLIVKKGTNPKFENVVSKDEFNKLFENMYEEQNERLKKGMPLKQNKETKRICEKSLSSIGVSISFEYLYDENDKLRTFEDIHKKCSDNAEYYSIGFNRCNVFEKVINALYSLEHDANGIRQLIDNNSMHFTEDDIEKHSSINTKMKTIQSFCKTVIFRDKENIEIKDIFARLGVDFDKFKYYGDKLTKGKVYTGYHDESKYKTENTYDILGEYIETIYTPKYGYEKSEDTNNVEISVTDEIVERPLFFNCNFDVERIIKNKGNNSQFNDVFLTCFLLSYSGVNEGEQNIYPLYELTKTEVSSKRIFQYRDYDKRPKGEKIDELMDVFYTENIKNIRECFNAVNKNLHLNISESTLSFRRDGNSHYMFLNLTNYLYYALSKLGHHEEKETLRMMNVFSDFKQLKDFLEKH